MAANLTSGRGWALAIEADRLANWLLFSGNRRETISTHAWAARERRWARVVIWITDRVDHPGHCRDAWIRGI